jgi:glutaminase
VLQKGDARLAVQVERTAEYYCPACALKMLDKALAQIAEIRAELTEQAAATAGTDVRLPGL